MLTIALLTLVLGADGGVDAGRPVVDAGMPVATNAVPSSGCSSYQEICFSPGGKCDARLAAMIDKAKVTLEVLIYSLNRPDVVQAILRAKARGVVVRMIIDTSQAKQAKELVLVKSLLKAGIPIRRSTHRGIMHMKVTLADDNWLSIGSFNYTDGASSYNDENMLIWSCAKNAAIYKARFEAMWPKFMDASDLMQR